MTEPLGGPALPAGIEREEAPRGLRRVGLVLGPLLFLLCLYLPGEALDAVQRRVAAVTALTAVWWIFAVLPVGATSLLPAVLFPLLGVLGAQKVAPLYMQDLVFLFLGAFIVALGLERWNVHKRFALWTIARIGTQPRRLVLGFMVASAFVSLWINNTSTVLLMMPIGVAVIRSVGGETRRGYDPFAVSLLLGMAYSASVGGVGTPVGTTPNQVLLGILGTMYPDAPPITFGGWMAAWLPLVVLYIPVGWILLTRVAIRVPAGSARSIDTIARERAALGPMGRGEKRMTAVFLTTALLWITRGGLDLGVVRIPGWAGLVTPAGSAAPAELVTDATVATAMAVLCFLVPVDRRRGIRLMDWRTAAKMPWEVLLLIGGGFAIAGAFQSSGLDHRVGTMLAPLIEGRSEWIVVAAVVALTAALTEVTSNTATTMVLLPVLGQMAAEAGFHPLLLMAPATIAASAAFMLPVSTPPNAVVFSTRLVSVARMARVGFWFEITVGTLIVLVFQLWGRWVGGIGTEPPPWAGGG
ncbi:MAG: SLC13 family permease [Planctomycetota bacterium]